MNSGSFVGRVVLQLTVMDGGWWGAVGILVVLWVVGGTELYYS